MERGANPTDRIKRFLVDAGVLPRPAKFGAVPASPAEPEDTAAEPTA